MRKILTEKGVTLVETMIGAAMLGGIALGVFSLSSDMQKIASQLNSIKAINSVKQRIIQSANSNGGWKKTIAASGIACLVNKTDCAAVSGQELPLSVQTGDSSLTSSTDFTLGFDQNGLLCSKYSETNKEPNCPFRYETFLMLSCPSSGPCTNPQERIIGRLKVTPKLEKKIGSVNPLKYSFSVYRGEMTNTLSESCEAYGGQFDPINKTCTLPLEGTCSQAGHVVVAINPENNTKICGPLIAGVSCARGQVMMGMSAGGVPTCVDLQPCCTPDHPHFATGCVPPVPPITPPTSPPTVPPTTPTTCADGLPPSGEWGTHCSCELMRVAENLPPTYCWCADFPADTIPPPECTSPPPISDTPPTSSFEGGGGTDGGCDGRGGDGCGP